MAVATSTLVGLALAAAAAGTQYYNTERTAKRQDNALAGSLREQGVKQREADAKVAAEVEKMKGSTAEASRQEAQAGYMDTLRKGRSKLEAGLTPNIGGDAFRADSAAAAEGVQQFGADRAGLMARIDAPGMQRQDEAFGYGRLATDLGLIGRESRGQSFIDELRMKAIRRDAGLDALASFMGGAAGGVASGGTAAAGASGASNLPGYAQRYG